MLTFWDYNYLYYWNKEKIKFLSKPYWFCSITMVFQILASAWNIKFFQLNACLSILNILLNVIPQIETIIFFPSPYTVIRVYISISIYVICMRCTFRKCVKKYKGNSVHALFSNKHWLKNKPVTKEFYSSSAYSEE